MHNKVGALDNDDIRSTEHIPMATALDGNRHVFGSIGDMSVRDNYRSEKIPPTAAAVSEVAPPSYATDVETVNQQDSLVPSSSSREEDSSYGIAELFITLLSGLLALITLPFSLALCLKVYDEFERGVVLRFGRLIDPEPRGPGIFFILPCIDSLQKIDIRSLVYDVPRQEVLSRDSVTVAVDAVMNYRVFDPNASVLTARDSDRSTRLLAQTVLRNVLGTRTLADILSERDAIAAEMRDMLDAATPRWGIRVERVELKDVRLPSDVQRAMAAEAEAAREARARLISSEGERDAARALAEASQELSRSNCALQLRYLQTLNIIAAEKDTTILFPLPMEFKGHHTK